MLAVFGQFFLPALLGFTVFFCIILCLRFITKLMQPLTSEPAKAPHPKGPRPTGKQGGR